jgi:DNA-3-methyladenine glycosylase I
MPNAPQASAHPAPGPPASPDGLRPYPDGLARCWWGGDDPAYVAYHDTEWGVAVHDDVRLFEKLCLEGFQAGLSWLTILRKREAFRAGFAGFDPATVARFDATDVERLLGDAGIVRHRGKIEAAIGNARATLDLVDTEGSLDAFVWRYAPDDHPVPVSMHDVPASTPASTALSKDLKRRGFRFVGPTTAYAFMQSMGLVDDHLAGCAVRTGAIEPR